MAIYSRTSSSLQLGLIILDFRPFQSQCKGKAFPSLSKGKNRQKQGTEVKHKRYGSITEFYTQKREPTLVDSLPFPCYEVTFFS